MGKINNEKIQEKVYYANLTFLSGFLNYVHKFMYEVYEIASLQYKGICTRDRLKAHLPTSQNMSAKSQDGECGSLPFFPR